MPEFIRTIFKVEQPLYEAALAELQEQNGGAPKIELVEAEPGARADVVRLHIRYTHEMDILLLGFKIGRTLAKGGQGNG